MAKLVTGGTGYIGSELARQLVARGEEVVLFDIVLNRYRIEDFADKVKLIQGDLGNYSQVMNAVKDNGITEIYHLGSMLTYVSELDIWASFRANVIGTYNMLEAARLFGVKKMVFTSTLGTFGLDLDEVVTDTSLQRPLTMYGCGKLYGEGLGRIYQGKFGLDFRSVRFAHMIGPNVRTPGHWAPPMIEDAILGKPNECVFGGPDTGVSMIYVADAARACAMIMDAQAERIEMQNYNVTGIPSVTTAAQVEAYLKTRYPGTKVTYRADTSVRPEVRRRHATMKVFDDSYARKEWGWKPQHETVESIVQAFERDMKEHPRRFGLK